MSVGWLVLVVFIIGFYLYLQQGSGQRGERSVLRAGPPAHHWDDADDYDFDIVGESHYQKAIKRLAGEHGDSSARTTCRALLIPENDNPYDSSAVCVTIESQIVGHLSREDAKSFRRRLGRKKLSGKVTSCDALIVGGGLRNGERLYYGVRLAIKPFD